MSLNRPKILTAVTVPTGGWAFQSDVSVAAQYDTTCDVTVPAGTYFVSGDNQSDDLLFALQTAIQTRLTAIGANRKIGIWIDPDTHKVNITYCGTAFVKGAAHVDDVRIDWTATASGLYEALGFDGSAADTSTATDEPVFTADWQHAWGWYSDEDGQLEHMPIEDTNIITAWQATALTGRTKGQLVGDRWSSSLKLSFLERCSSGRTKVFSRGVAYGAASVYPYERNQPLECWWMEARKGTRFRVYPDGYLTTGRAAGYDPTATDAGGSTFDITGTLDTDPQRFKSAIVYCPDMGAVIADSRVVPQSYFISSHDSNTITIANQIPAGDVDAVPVYFFDHRYQTYVVDISQMARFGPVELGDGLDKFSIQIPLKRYVA